MAQVCVSRASCRRPGSLPATRTLRAPACHQLSFASPSPPAGVFIPQYTGRWTKRRQRNRSPRRDKQGAALGGKAGAQPLPGSPTSTLQGLEACPSQRCPIAALPCDDDFTKAYSRH